MVLYSVLVLLLKISVVFRIQRKDRNQKPPTRTEPRIDARLVASMTAISAGGGAFSRVDRDTIQCAIEVLPLTGVVETTYTASSWRGTSPSHAGAQRQGMRKWTKTTLRQDMDRDEQPAPVTEEAHGFPWQAAMKLTES